MPAKPVGAPKKTVGLRPRRLRSALEDGVRRRPLGHQHDGGAHAQREGQRVAQAVGEEELGGREADVALAQAQHAPCRRARPSSTGWRACAPCPWAGRWIPTNRARTPGRRRRWRPAWRSGACACTKASKSTSPECQRRDRRARRSPCCTSWSLLASAGLQRRQQRRRTPAPPARASAPACRRSRRRSAACSPPPAPRRRRARRGRPPASRCTSCISSSTRSSRLTPRARSPAARRRTRSASWP